MPPAAYAPQVDGTSRPEFNPSPADGSEVTIETYVVAHGHEQSKQTKGPNGVAADLGMLVCRDSEGRRIVANTKCSYDEKGKVVSQSNYFITYCSYALHLRTFT